MFEERRLIFGNLAYVEDSLHHMQWTLTNEKKEILGYKYKSATTTFIGRTYTVYYAPKIPVSNGPWKFGGLPGLILEVLSSDEEYSWIATQIVMKPKDFAINYENIHKIKFISWAEYVSKSIESADKFMAKRRAENAENTAPSFLKWGGMEIIHPEVQLGQGFKF